MFTKSSLTRPEHKGSTMFRMEVLLLLSVLNIKVLDTAVVAIEDKKGSMSTNNFQCSAHSGHNEYLVTTEPSITSLDVSSSCCDTSYSLYETNPDFQNDRELCVKELVTSITNNKKMKCTADYMNCEYNFENLSCAKKLKESCQLSGGSFIQVDFELTCSFFHDKTSLRIVNAVDCLGTSCTRGDVMQIYSTTPRLNLDYGCSSPVIISRLGVPSHTESSPENGTTKHTIPMILGATFAVFLVVLVLTTLLKRKKKRNQENEPFPGMV